MQIGEITFFAHTVAESVAAGVCLVAAQSSVDDHGVAAESHDSQITVDFLTGRTSGARVSNDLRDAVKRISESLPDFAARHGLDISEIKVLSARYGTDAVAGRHFLLTVETSDGRSCVEQYGVGPGKRYGKPRRSKSDV